MTQPRDEKGRFIRDPNRPQEPVEEPIATGFKGTNMAGYCQRTHYMLGRKYSIRENPVLCSRGYHYCERPVDVFSYYPPDNSRYFAVEAYGKVDKGFRRASGYENNPNVIDLRPLDTKCSAKGLVCVKELSLEDMFHAQNDLDMKRSVTVTIPQTTLIPGVAPNDVIYSLRAEENSARLFATDIAGAVAKEAIISHAAHCTVSLASGSTSICHCGGSIAISLGSQSMAYAKGRSSVALVNASQSAVMTEGESSLAINMHSSNALVSKGDSSVAVSMYFGSRMEIHGDYSICVATCSSVYTYGKNNVVVFRSHDEWGKHGKFKEGTLVIFMRERVAPIAIRIGKDVPLQDEYEIPKLRKAAEKAQLHAALIKNPSHVKLVAVREEITNLLETIDTWKERKDDIYMNSVKTRLNEILETIDDSPWKGKKKNGQAD